MKKDVVLFHREFAPLCVSADYVSLRHTLARHQPSGLPRPVPLGRGSRKVFFAAYTPPQKTDLTSFAPLRRRELCETLGDTLLLPCGHPLPLPLGEVAERSEDGEGKRCMCSMVDHAEKAPRPSQSPAVTALPKGETRRRLRIENGKAAEGRFAVYLGRFS